MKLLPWVRILLRGRPKEIRQKLRDALIRRLAPLPVEPRNFQRSVCFSADDDISGPSERLLSIILEAIPRIREISFNRTCAGRSAQALRFMNVWPGEHYKLLAALMLTLKPKGVVEVGTFTGWSALAMKTYLPSDGRLATFDVRDWSSDPDYVLRPEDFQEGRLVQYLDDLSQPNACRKHRALLENSDLFFVDAAKDGVMEYRFWENLRAVNLKPGALMVFDDIRVWNMLRFWREISLPKLDATSFGHWSGTGLVELAPAP